MRANAYGSHMIFTMASNRDNFETVQLPTMQRIARSF